MEYDKGFRRFAWNYFCSLWRKQILQLKDLYNYKKYIEK